MGSELELNSAEEGLTRSWLLPRHCSQFPGRPGMLLLLLTGLGSMAAFESSGVQLREIIRPACRSIACCNSQQLGTGAPCDECRCSSVAVATGTCKASAFVLQLPFTASLRLLTECRAVHVCAIHMMHAVPPYVVSACSVVLQCPINRGSTFHIDSTSLSRRC